MSSTHPRLSPRPPGFWTLQIAGWLAFGVAMGLSRVAQYPLGYMLATTLGPQIWPPVFDFLERARLLPSAPVARQRPQSTSALVVLPSRRRARQLRPQPIGRREAARR